ncbi:hypothetical protein ELQ35_14770 [Peribacillus cavernae]|uniref:Uncharacterized protein n=1 Tax=Peribacillus cavernae TaxID=1674310 RepID=A0A433HHT3_9BACI|nr:hypothetical protein [Peribacillus cavernae]MDQ0219324.1 DNA-binding transcriptional ArsR family regulator [Peribacillus cavernae]RUQ27795.1 hypothetical protein ELQ35_14770 [Peribacillus cavernae]
MSSHIQWNLAEYCRKMAIQLADEDPITRQGILKYLKILKDAGLATVHQEGRDKRYSSEKKPSFRFLLK